MIVTDHTNEWFTTNNSMRITIFKCDLNSFFSDEAIYVE